MLRKKKNHFTPVHINILSHLHSQTNRKKDEQTETMKTLCQKIACNQIYFPYLSSFTYVSVTPIHCLTVCSRAFHHRTQQYRMPVNGYSCVLKLMGAYKSIRTMFFRYKLYHLSLLFSFFLSFQLPIARNEIPRYKQIIIESNFFFLQFIPSFVFTLSNGLNYY